MSLDSETRAPARTNFVLLSTVLTGSYFAFGKLGLGLAAINPSTSAVWAPTGIALAAFLLAGGRAWFGIFLGAFLVNFLTTGVIATSLAIACGNTAEGWLAAYLVQRYAAGREAFEHAHNVLSYTASVMLSCMLSATVGASTLALGGLADWSATPAIWLTWWLGDVVGALVIAPGIIIWAQTRQKWMGGRRLVEYAVLLGYLLMVGEIVFGVFSGSPRVGKSLEFLCVPFLVWAAVRFRPLEASFTILVMAAMAAWSAMRGVGPFLGEPRHESLLVLQSFTGVMAAMTLTLAAAVVERSRAEERVKYLATTDPLTELANYRKLMETLQLEVDRASRLNRTFALILLDLNGLKKINDTQGHLVGSRALRRVASVLRATCRTFDTAARYGGDEFALVLPEATSAAARRVASRIHRKLADDTEEPRISVSIGVAEYPKNGRIHLDLIEFADAELYEMKRHVGDSSPPEPRSTIRNGNDVAPRRS